MSINNLIKRLQNIMRQDSGVDGDAQRIAQIVWILFLKVYDAKEQLWEFDDDNYESIIPNNLRWSNWAVDNKDGKSMTGEELLEFVNEELFPSLKALKIDEFTPRKARIVKDIFEDAYNYMKNGILLRQVINLVDEIDFTEPRERHAFNDIYELILKDLQSAGSSGEFYTPRAITDFIAEIIDPQIAETIADFACGTGGLLISSLDVLQKKAKTVEDNEIINKSLFGVEKKNLPHLLCMTNLLLHDIDDPNIIHGNSLEKNVRDYKEEDRFDCIVMNPPYGGVEEKIIQSNFPTELQTSETADLFMASIIYRLKKNGRCAVVLPDNFLFGTNNSQKALKEKLLKECNLHSIVRLCNSCFAPYTSIKTNIVVFTKGEPTKKIDYYDFQTPEGYKNLSKTRPLKSSHLDCVRKWWANKEIDDINAYSVSIDEVVAKEYNLDIKNPKRILEERELTLDEILLELENKSKNIVNAISKLQEILRGIGE